MAFIYFGSWSHYCSNFSKIIIKIYDHEKLHVYQPVFYCAINELSV